MAWNRWGKAEAVVVASLFLFTLALPLVVSSDSVAGAGRENTPSLALSPAHQKQKPDWNKNHYNWEDFEDNSSVAVIIAMDDEQFKSLNKNLQNKLSKAKDQTYSSAFIGISATLDAQTLDSILQENPSIQIQPDFPVKATVATTQTGANIMWNRTDDWGYNVDGHNTTIAIIDTGINYNHPDLGGGFGPTYKVIGGYDYVNHDSNPMDDNGHGTHCAGIAAANGTIKGMAPDAKLYAYKVLNSAGNGYTSDIVAAIQRSEDPNSDGNTSDHVDVISMSLGGEGTQTDALCLAVKAAVAVGVVVVVATGNDGPEMQTVSSPGMAPEAVTVGAVNSTGVLASWSSRGPAPDLSIKPEISAPGVSIYSTYLGTGYYTMSGTSMATPHVAGACALLLQAHPAWTPQQVKSALVEGAGLISESIWIAGSGQLWVPNATDIDIFASLAPISYGMPNGTAMMVNFTNTGEGVNLTVTTEDWNSLAYNGSVVSRVWSNVSSVSNPLLNISSNTTSSELFNVTIPGPEVPDGFYDGVMYLTNATHNIRLAFGFILLSKLRVHVLNMIGSEVYDYFGGVWVHSLPDASVFEEAYNTATFSPPANFMLPSGNYSVHSAGHNSIYGASDTFMLSGNVSIAPRVTQDIYLNMTAARVMTLDLSTSDGHPIYVKDFRMYWRHEGTGNASAHICYSDYSIIGSAVFSIPDSKTIYVSDTNATIGIAVSGYSYSDIMWDFMERNWQHWYQYPDLATNFKIEATGDLQYLLSWEFPGVNSTVSTDLNLKAGNYSIYETKYDLPGFVDDPYGDSGTDLSIGGTATFYMRRSTDTSLVSIFSGLTRRTYVQGVFCERYFPTDLTNGFFERTSYISDYSHVTDIGSGVYLPDMDYFTPIPSENVSEHIGLGPYYPGLRTFTTNDSFIFTHPILVDQSGARIGCTVTTYTPRLDLFRNGPLINTYSLTESRTQTVPERVVALPGAGTYKASFVLTPTPIIGSSATVNLGFVVPSTDLNPPRITTLNMSQRFTPGDAIPISFEAVDDVSSVTGHLEWRKTGGSWANVPLSESPVGNFSGTISTDGTTYAVDLRVTVTDVTGNYLNYTLVNSAKQEIPVIFDLAPVNNEVKYNATTQTVTLNGQLTNSTGSPLHPTACVPLDLMIGSKKVAMILDENVSIGAHTHNGTISFPWMLNATKIFSGPNQSVEVNVTFDMGIYENKTVSFLLNSTFDSDFEPPTITTSPPATVTEDSNYYYDANADQLIDTWSLAGNCTAFLSVNPSTGVVSGTPNNSYANKWYDANLTATNGAGVAYQNFTVSVWNTPPIITPPPVTGSMGYPYNYNIQHGDEGIGTPPGNFTGIITNCTDSYSFESNGWLNWTPTAPGTVWWNVTADDQIGMANSTAYLNWTVTITDKTPLILNSPSLEITVWYFYFYNSSCTPADSGANSWSLNSNATWLSVLWSNQTQCNVTGTPTSGGNFWANLTVWDADSDDYVNWTVTVNVYAPSITSNAILGVREDHPYSYDAVANQTVTWAFISNATWLSMDLPNGTVSGIPDNAVSEWDFWVNASCSNLNGTAYQNYTVHVWNLQPAFTPDIGIPPMAGMVDRAVSYDANHSDEGVGVPPGDFVGVTTNYTGAYTFDTLHGYLNFTPGLVGSFWFNITGDDRRGIDNSTNYQNWTIEISQKAPYIVSSPIIVITVWVLFYFNCSATSPDIGITVWGCASNATWLLFVWGNQTQYNVSGTPVVLGSFYVNFSVNDSDSSHYLNFTVTVVVGPAPTITSSPILGVTEDGFYFYLPVADQAVTWFLLWADGTWLVFDPLNGSLMGIPDNSESEFGFNIWLRADTMNGTDTQMWGIFVWNNPPVFNATPMPDPYANVGTAWFYNPGTSDESIGTTVYTVTTDFPGWYTIDATTGNLIFSPTAAGTFWFDILFDDMSLVGNSTVSQNFTVTVYPLGVIPPSPSAPGVVWPSFKYVMEGLTVSFSDNSYGSAIRYIWDFGDGTGSNSQNPTHFYLGVGVYTVTLTVIGSDNKSYVVTGRINVGEGLPFSQTDEGWKVRMTDELVVDVSAMGMLITGLLLWVSATLFKQTLVMTRKGRMVVGSLLILAAIYYFIFVNNGWIP